MQRGYDGLHIGVDDEQSSVPGDAHGHRQLWYVLPRSCGMHDEYQMFRSGKLNHSQRMMTSSKNEPGHNQIYMY